MGCCTFRTCLASGWNGTRMPWRLTARTGDGAAGRALQRLWAPSTGGGARSSPHQQPPAAVGLRRRCGRAGVSAQDARRVRRTVLYRNLLPPRALYWSMPRFDFAIRDRDVMTALPGGTELTDLEAAPIDASAAAHGFPAERTRLRRRTGEAAC